MRKNEISAGAMKEARAVFGTCLLAFVLCVTCVCLLAVKERFFKSPIIFYGYIKYLIVFFFAVLALFFIIRFFLPASRNFLKPRMIVLALFLSTSVSYSVLMTFPIITDRSFSVFILGSLDKYPEGVSHDELKNISLDYFVGQNVIEKRIVEQLETGTITDNDRVKLTPRGKNIVRVNGFIGKFFNLDMKNILP